MKKYLGLLTACLMLAIASPASAADQLGVYVAPKFIYGLTQMDAVKGHWTDTMTGESGSIRIGNKTDDTFGGSIAVGYDFGKRFGVPIRGEVEYAAFSRAEAKRSYTNEWNEREKLKQTFDIQTLFFNAYWDIDTGTRFTPYLGAGLGMAFIGTKMKSNGYDIGDPDDSWSESTGSKTVTNFAWNVGAGLGYDLTENWTLDAGYRFAHLGSVKTKTFSDDESTFHGKTSNLYQHQFAIGVRYTF